MYFAVEILGKCLPTVKRVFSIAQAKDFFR